MSKLYNSLHRKFITPLSDVVTGWGMSSSLQLLEKSQYWSKEELYEFQLSRLRILADFAYNNSLFYKKKFDNANLNPSNIRSLSDLKKIPVITKSELRADLLNKVSTIRSLKKNTYSMTATSGSTGLQLIYPISNQAYGMINAAAIRGWEWMGFELGDRFMKISQNKRKSKLKKVQDKVNNSLLFTNKYNEEGVKNFIDSFVTFHPQYLRSYPDPLMFIGKYLAREGIQLSGLKAINTTGNILFDEDRKFIESIFKAPIYDSYSCEGSTQLFQCESRDYYHMSDEYAITEIIDENGHEVNDGETGRLVTTDLWNLATPFIRYDTNDFVVKGGQCSCGRQLGTVKKIFGRNNDILKVNENFFIAQNFTTYFKYFQEIIQFKVIQISKNEVEFNFVVENALKELNRKKIEDYWKLEFGKGVIVRIKEVESILPLKSGKTQFVFRNPEISIY